MMNTELRNSYETICSNTDRWFSGYSRSFLSGDYQYDHGYELKILHTKNVERHAEELALYLDTQNGRDGRRQYGARLAALLHDAGRFEQFKRYRTFNDSISEDHGKISLDLIEEQELLKEIDAIDEHLGRAIRFAVFEHNKLNIPPIEDGLSLSLAKIVRDADRIDIFRIMAEHLEKQDDAGEEAVFLHLSDTKTISGPVYQSILKGEMVHRNNLTSRSDFLCQILSWVQIMNYPYSCKKINDSGNFTAVLARLPENKEGREVQALLRREMDDKLQQLSFEK